MRQIDEIACVSRKSTIVQLNTFGLHSGVWVIDWAPRQEYNLHTRKVKAVCFDVADALVEIDIAYARGQLLHEEHPHL